LLPTFGATIESRTNSTMYSRAFMPPEGTGVACLRAHKRGDHRE
jgi:hypothetical protein